MLACAVIRYLAASSVLIAVVSLSILMLLFRDNQCILQATKLLSSVGECLSLSGRRVEVVRRLGTMT